MLRGVVLINANSSELGFERAIFNTGALGQGTARERIDYLNSIKPFWAQPIYAGNLGENQTSVWKSSLPGSNLVFRPAAALAVMLRHSSPTPSTT